MYRLDAGLWRTWTAAHRSGDGEHRAWDGVLVELVLRFVAGDGWVGILGRGVQLDVEVEDDCAGNSPAVERLYCLRTSVELLTVRFLTDRNLLPVISNSPLLLCFRLRKPAGESGSVCLIESVVGPSCSLMLSS